MNIKIINQNKDIARVIINEPKTYNSLSYKNLKDLINIFKKLDKDKKIKVIILEGAGKGFSAGHNLKELKDLRKKERYKKLFNLCSKLMLQIVEGKKPVIAKVHGAAYAAGCQLVASCDLAYSTKDALFATPVVPVNFVFNAARICSLFDAIYSSVLVRDTIHKLPSSIFLTLLTL